MQHVSELISGAQRHEMTIEEKDAFTEMHMRNIADIHNREVGHLDEQDGYNCIKCLNRGSFLLVYRRADNMLSSTLVPCSCMKERMSYVRGKGTGIPEGCTFERFKADTDWQQGMIDTARDYYNSGAWRKGTWLYAGGAVGSGKTHIISAICRELLTQQTVVFMSWIKDSRPLKASVNEPWVYSINLDKYISADLLAIDDLWKRSQKPTEADLRLAYDILNERYTQHKPTLISSEWTLDELYEIDQAIASRIVQMCGKYVINVGRGEGKDMRMRYLRT